MEDREGSCFVKVFKVHTMVHSNIHTYQLKSSQAKARQQHTKVFVPPEFSNFNQHKIKTTNAKQNK